MPRIQRKSAPKVKAGRVQRQNNWELTPNYYNTAQRLIVFDRRKPGAGYRHILNQADIESFISLLPDWNELSRGLDGIVLAEGEDQAFGYHTQGVIHICAWPSDLWIPLGGKFYKKNADILHRLGVPCEPEEHDNFLCKFTRGTACAFQLLSTFLHELGHHHDRVNTETQIRPSRGEPYAEAYAREHEAQIWTRYQEIFGILG